MKSKEQKQIEALLRDYDSLCRHVRRVENKRLPLKDCLTTAEKGDHYSQRTLARIRDFERRFPAVAEQVARIHKTDHMVYGV